jgi:hypothetical protein
VRELIAVGALVPYLFALVTGRWRLALLCIVPIGFAQDALRKLTPGEPVWLVMLAVAAVAPVVLHLLLQQGAGRLNDLFPRDVPLRNALRLFMVLLVLQVANGLLHAAAPVVVGIGLLFYLAPLAALWLGYRYAQSVQAVERFVWVYLAVSLLASVTVALSYIGVPHPVLREVGAGVQIFVEGLGYLQGHSGILRSSEVAAWHITAGACLLVVLAVARGRPWQTALALLLALGLVLLTTVTGRRKVVMLAALFVAIYLLLIWKLRSGAGKGSVLAGLFIAAVVVVAGSFIVGEVRREEQLSALMARTGTVFSDVDERANSVGLGSIPWAYRVGGPLGLGVGAAAQGSQHFGGGASQGAGEAGTGKLLVELGLPGFALAAVLGLLFTRHYRNLIRQLRRQRPRLALLLFGLMAFLAANVPVFAVASQVYGDPFILLLLGLMAGFVLAAPRIVAREAQEPT